MIRRTHLHALAGILLVLWISGAAAAALLPERVPIHWNLQGEVDGYGPGWAAALLMPGLATLASGLLLGLFWAGPLKGNLERSALAYGRCMVAVVLLLLGFHGVVVARGFGVEVPVGPVMMMLIGLLIAALGNWMGKVRRNFWIGIRTPWTLASDVVWERTHRIGGRALVAHGLTAAVVSLLAPPVVGLAYLLGGLSVIAIWSAVYSLVVYRRVGQVEKT